MDNTPSPAVGENSSGSPNPDVLKPRVDDSSSTTGVAPNSPAPAAGSGARPRHRTYRPSHKATFIGLAVVVVILAVNVVILGFVLRNKTKTNDLANSGQVTISSSVLSKVGINSGTIGSSGVQLTVDPDAQFKGKVTVAGDTTIAGQLKLNSTLTGSG